ncbi:matrixin family metalloprotease [Paenibacillus sp. FSL H8-0122]|uniref:matrixin family metalloprotease n=1 Tax=Paenibacillus sp. FSL H8-0122 TaxID=2954510 RepID=UPI0030F8E090
MKRNFLVGIITLFISTSFLVSNVNAVPGTNGKWPSRFNTLYINSNSINSPWATGAAKWYNNTNFKVSTSVGVSSTYYAVNVFNSSVTWDGLTSKAVNNGILQSAILNLNTYYTSSSMFTNSILAGVTGHEVGHSLGLTHTSVVESSSIMHPYTFNSDGSLARALSPSSSDIDFVNGLYPALAISSEEAESELEDTRYDSLEDGVYIHPSWAVYYEDKEALTKAADLVVKGKVIGEAKSDFTKGDYLNYSTKVNIEIIDTLKGDDSPGQIITISQMGGTDGQVTVFSESSTHLKDNQEAILFLRKINENTFIPLNEDDGIFIYELGQFKNIKSNKEL